MEEVNFVVKTVLADLVVCEIEEYNQTWFFDAELFPERINVRRFRGEVEVEDGYVIQGPEKAIDSQSEIKLHVVVDRYGLP